MMEKINVEEMKGAQATALLLLEEKAYYPKFVPKEEWIIDFSKIQEICKNVSFGDLSVFTEKKESQKRFASIRLASRSKSFDELLNKYLGQSEKKVVVQFGCGLSDRSVRYEKRIIAGLPFFDIDLPEVIELRRKFYIESENYKMIASDLSKYTWIKQIPKALRERQFIFIAEGVTPYLTEDQMREMFAKLKENFPGCILIMGTISKMKFESGKNMMKNKFDADFHFSNNDPLVMQKWEKEGAYEFLEEDKVLYRKDFLFSKHVPWSKKIITRIFAYLFSWHTGISRSSATLVYKLGKK